MMSFFECGCCYQVLYGEWVALCSHLSMEKQFYKWYSSLSLELSSLLHSSLHPPSPYPSPQTAKMSKNKKKKMKKKQRKQAEMLEKRIQEMEGAPEGGEEEEEETTADAPPCAPPPSSDTLQRMANDVTAGKHTRGLCFTFNLDQKDAAYLY